MALSSVAAAPDVSVCVATCGRPDGLARLLASLERLKLPEGIAWELLVVDNDAAGSAARVLDRFRAALPLRDFVEPRRNIAHARNLALAEARGRWVAFVDDDEEVGEGWLASYWSCVEGRDADGWFGPVLPALESVRTPWLDAERFYGRPRHETGTPLGVPDLSTSNALVRRSWLEVRRFDPSFGRSGGSDTELFARLLRAGARFEWCDEAVVTDHVPASRHRPGWLVQRAFRGGVVTTRLERRWRSGIAADFERGARALAGIAVCAAWLPLAACAGRPRATRALMRAAVQVGHLWALLGGGYEEYRG